MEVAGLPCHLYGCSADYGGRIVQSLPFNRMKSMFEPSITRSEMDQLRAEFKRELATFRSELISDMTTAALAIAGVILNLILVIV